MRFYLQSLIGPEYRQEVGEELQQCYPLYKQPQNHFGNKQIENITKVFLGRISKNCTLYVPLAIRALIDSVSYFT